LKNYNFSRLFFIKVHSNQGIIKKLFHYLFIKQIYYDFYLSCVIVNKLMRESWTWLIILHFTPVLFTNVFITIYTRPFAILNIIYPKGILHIIISFILIFTQTLKILSLSSFCLLKILLLII
jgi:hypothetical protein